MSEKVVRKGYLTREEMKEILRSAQEQCKREVPISSHKTPAGKTRLGIPRERFITCLSNKIKAMVREKLKAKGYNVE